MLPQDSLTTDFGVVLPDDPDAARVALERDLAGALRPARDYFDDRVDLLRQWVTRHKISIGEQWLLGLIDGKRAALLFSLVAETVINMVLPQVTTILAHTQGRLLRGRFVVVALGKLGSREMTVQSDLDLLFIYDVPGFVEESDGPDPTAISAYYAKLGQKLIAALTIMTEKGALFEVDMRLRPFGDSGPITSSLNAFRRYYQNDAWTWEHMALTRARVIAGDPDLAAKVTDEIRSILMSRRDHGKTLGDIAEMRERIARQYPSTIPWDLKHRRGGLVDIEFVAQAYQLIHAADAPEVLAQSTAEALLRLGEHKLLPAATAQDLVMALNFWQGLQGLVRVSLDRVGESKVTAQLFDKILMDVTGLDEQAAREGRAAAAASVADGHFRSLIAAFAPGS